MYNITSFRTLKTLKTFDLLITIVVTQTLGITRQWVEYQFGPIHFSDIENKPYLLDLYEVKIKRRRKMNRKIINGMLLLTVIALFVAPQVITSDFIMPIPVFVLFLILGLWLNFVIKNWLC